MFQRTVNTSLLNARVEEAERCVRALIMCYVFAAERYRIAFSYQPRYRRYRLELFSMLRAIAPEVRYYSSLNPLPPPPSLLADSRIRVISRIIEIEIPVKDP